MTHDDAVAAIASVVEQYNEIILRVGKVTQYETQTIDDSEMKLVMFSFNYVFRPMMGFYFWRERK